LDPSFKPLIQLAALQVISKRELTTNHNLTKTCEMARNRYHN